MSNKLLTGVWRMLVGVPPVLWEKQIERITPPAMARHPRRPLSGIHCFQRKAWIPAQKPRGNDALCGVDGNQPAGVWKIVKTVNADLTAQ